MTATALQEIDVATPRRKWPRYPRYEPTGVPWLGSIPAHWNINRLGWTIESARNGVWGSEPDGTGDIHCVRVADFDRVAFKIGDEIPTLRSVSASERRGRVLQKGDLLLEKSGGGELQPVGAVAVFDSALPAICSNFLARLVPASNCNSRYLSYLHAHLYSARVNVRSIKQTTGIQNLDAYSYFCEQAPFPPLEEQRAIAMFLDRETTRIDELIAKKQRLDELLAEKARSLQSLAVTGNAQAISNASATEIPWLPSCPEEWQLLPLRRVIKWIEQGWSPSCDGREAEADEWGVLKAGCVNTGELDESDNKKLPDDIAPEVSYQIRPGDVLMSRACGTASLVGSVAFVKQCREKLLLCDKVFRLHPIPSRILPEFLAEALKSKASRAQIEQSLSGADGLANNITQATIKGIVIAVPPLEEQQRICSAIYENRKKIHGLRITTRTATVRLREYRSALITAAVTGQIDVRNYREEALCP